LNSQVNLAEESSLSYGLEVVLVRVFLVCGVFRRAEQGRAGIVPLSIPLLAGPEVISAKTLQDGSRLV
jgi:hypothetical protein